MTRPTKPEANRTKTCWDLIKGHFGEDGPATAVETGSYRGGFAAGLIGATKKTHVFSVDSWVGRMGQGNLQVYLRRVPELFSRAHPLPGTSSNWAKVFPFTIDLLVLSGAPDPKTLRAELTAWLALVNPGGLVLVGDVRKAEMAEVVLDLLPKARTEALGPGHFLTAVAKV